MDADDLAFAGIAAQAELIRTGEITSRELVELYLSRIQRIDPELNAFREVFAEEARAAAADADERIGRGDQAPLLGVPVAFKDELDMEGRVARHGTSAYDEPATANAVHVQRMLDAGAIALGKTALPELAVCGFTESITSGDTRNPWDLSRTPGGSSGGSGAAVAAGLVGAASASDGAGSIRIPAALNGLFGLKPQRGRVSLMPEAEHWHGMSKTGCLTRRVADAALWLDVARGPADGDAHRPPPPDGSYVEAARTPPPRLRIGRSRATVRALVPPLMEAEALSALDRATAVLEGLGHGVEERDPDYGNAGNPMIALYLSGVREHLDTVPHPERLEARTRAFGRLGGMIPDRAVRSALRDQDAHAARINEVFDHVDALMTPVTSTLPVPVGRWRGKGAVRTLIGMSRVYPYTAIWNYTGQPAAAIPVGFTDGGLPLSVMLIVPPNREDLIFSLAGQMEAVIGWPDRRPPLDGT
ncbi:MAG: amidase family protein [Acidimicrobiales bacterium]